MVVSSMRRLQGAPRMSLMRPLAVPLPPGRDEHDSEQSWPLLSGAHVNKDDRQPEVAGRAGGRRQEYAEVTRQAIVSAARRLFAEKGYFSTRVEDIAAEARVAP